MYRIVWQTVGGEQLEQRTHDRQEAMALWFDRTWEPGIRRVAAWESYDFRREAGVYETGWRLVQWANGI